MVPERNDYNSKSFNHNKENKYTIGKRSNNCFQAKGLTFKNSGIISKKKPRSNNDWVYKTR